MRLIWLMCLGVFLGLGACQATNTGNPDGGESTVEGNPETSEPTVETTPESVVAGDCSAEQSCTKPKECVSPGPRRKVCGIPPMNECEQDADCQKNDPKAICKEGAGNCGGKACVAGCKADSECLVGESCKSDGHCKPKECIDNMTCPKNFVCNSSKTCERQNCQKSSDCLGFCVNTFCYDQKGICEEVLAVP